MAATEHERLAAWIRSEMDAQQLQPVDIERSGGPSWPTLKSLLDAEELGRRPATLRELSVSLGYEPDAAARVMRGEEVTKQTAPAGVLERLSAVEDMTAALLRTQVELIEAVRLTQGADERARLDELDRLVASVRERVRRIGEQVREEVQPQEPKRRRRGRS